MLGGTHIVFPWRYRNSRKCGPDQIINIDEPEIIADDPETDTQPEWLVMSPSGEAFVFSMEAGSQFNNICLQGPKPDIKEEFMAWWLHDGCPARGPDMQPLEGSVGGILLRGHNAQLNHSEVYGFPTLISLAWPVPLTEVKLIKYKPAFKNETSNCIGVCVLTICFW